MRIFVPLLAFPLLAFAVPVQAQTAAPSPDMTTPAAPSGESPAWSGNAHHGPRMSMQQRFDAANTTHDGKLTLEQANNGMRRVARHFKDIDKDGKGYVTLDDIHAYNAAQHKAHQHRAG
ncbi:MAG: EF-hand domain-containing protein [Acetobacteraceae bacterium]|nr:EF-hand domain-containing protein [Acetobacteraceae bacterium]